MVFSGIFCLFSFLWLLICWIREVDHYMVYFREDLARIYTAEIVSAVSHLHKNGIMHRDLKPENILLDADGHVLLSLSLSLSIHTHVYNILAYFLIFVFLFNKFLILGFVG